MDAVAHVDKLGESFIIRPFLRGDRAALRDMYDDFEPKRVAQGLPPAEEGQRAAWLGSILADGHHLVVEIEGRVVGHGMLLPMRDDDAELANFLHQATRDRGIGTTLNRALLELGRSLGIRRVWLSVEPFNRRAIRSYEKVGFQRRPMSPWSPEVEMEVELDGD
ncbi:MAG: GNAT family N-acetyltransferase [Longimicrobiales bacterium]|nr:GNAT family N-acetyltransferase [Longimicrobiales bacterium]